MNDFSKINRMQNCIRELQRQTAYRGGYPGMEAIGELSAYVGALHGALLALHNQASFNLPEANHALMRAREVLEIQK